MGRKRVRWFGVRFSLGMPSKTGFCPVQPILYRPLLFPVVEYKATPFHRDPHWANTVAVYAKQLCHIAHRKGGVQKLLRCCVLSFLIVRLALIPCVKALL